MKILLIPFLLLVIPSFAQSGSKEMLLPDSACYKIWWIDNKMGGYDGFELRKNGELKLLNYDLFVGEKWWTKGDHLITEIRSRENGKTHKTDYLIKKQTANSMVLNSLSYGESVTDYLEVINNDDFTDKLLGHWEGEGESYVQIVPKSSFQFQLVISESAVKTPKKFEGYLDEANKRIIFYLEQEEKELTLFVEAGKQTIFISGKRYSRKC